MKNWLGNLMVKLGYKSEDVHKDQLGKAYSRIREELSEEYKKGYKAGAFQIINSMTEAVKKLDNPDQPNP